MEKYWDNLLDNLDKERPRITLNLGDIDLLVATKHRYVYIVDEVDGALADDVVTMIFNFNAMDKGLSPEERKPIKIFISSPGGSVPEGMRIIDAITTSKTPIYTIVTGTAYSMAFEIAIAGHKRFAMPSSSFLIHDGSTMVFNSSSKSNDEAEFNKLCFQREQQAILKRTKIPEKQLQEMQRVEWYMFADRALELGIIDEIITDIDDIL